MIVGDPLKHQETYHLHLALLCAKSKYFSACLQGKFHEASSREAKLPDVDPHVFALFTKWLYTEDIAPFAHTITDCEIAARMVELYILGDRPVCEGVKNRAVDILQEASKSLYRVPLLKVVIKAVTSNALPKDSRVVQYLFEQLSYVIGTDGVQCCTSMCGSSWLNLVKILDAAELTKMMCRFEFYKEKLYGRTRSEQPALSWNPADLFGCEWHEHSDARRSVCGRWRQGLRDWNVEAEAEKGHWRKFNLERAQAVWRQSL